MSERAALMPAVTALARSRIADHIQHPYGILLHGTNVSTSRQNVSSSPTLPDERRARSARILDRRPTFARELFKNAGWLQVQALERWHGKLGDP